MPELFPLKHSIPKLSNAHTTNSIWTSRFG